MDQIPKRLSIARTRDRSPLVTSSAIASSALTDSGSVEALKANITILARIIPTLFRCSTRRANVGMTTLDIEDTSSPEPSFPSKVDKAV